MRFKKPSTVVIFLLLFILFVILLAPRVLQVQALKTRSERLETELLKLRNQNRALEERLHLLQNDPVFLEKVARDKFNKAKQGEIVYRVVRE